MPSPFRDNVCSVLFLIAPRVWAPACLSQEGVAAKSKAKALVKNISKHKGTWVSENLVRPKTPGSPPKSADSRRKKGFTMPSGTHGLV